MVLFSARLFIYILTFFCWISSTSGELLTEATNSSLITVLASSRAVISGQLSPATIIISRVTGKIIAVYDSVLPAVDFPEGTLYTDHSPYVLLPGLIDTHVHLNQPGRTEWEGFYTGTQAAAFGGVTTVVDMPLNAIPPTTTVANLKEKVAAAQGKCWVDVGFFGGVIPGNSHELKALVHEGVRGFKGFLIDSGVDEFPAVNTEDIKKAMDELADEPTTLMFHAEKEPHEEPLSPTGPVDDYFTYLQSRPSTYETDAIAEVLSLAHLAPQLALHIVHLSAMEAIPMLREARAQGVHITAETCFHYLSLAAEQIRNGDTRYKCSPPIRSQENQDALWAELARYPDDGVIQTVVSDHSPCTPDLKLLPPHIPPQTDAPSHNGSFLTAWGGVSSGEDAKRALQDIVRLCCMNTAAQVGLEKQKGDLAVGMDADICVFDDTAEWVVEPSTMLFRNKISPYQGQKLRGVVRETWLRGERIFTRAAGFSDDKPSGKLLLERRDKRN
ncbi:hypothetical protein N7519_008557 [Penicillium mononematosum]|uniref:uncharacterized protein n=1 Tax=Penicillium mononematosum TaxID=268346 RepID=UPI0025495560|nr:uncharacterized protein N7519_008557 [Penicillium mononematosum]KAJ6178096.1 hypothetical protein N7519_008557 [Penicillium mononematosum]